MTDSEGDSIWTVTLPLTADSIEYKFTLDGWTGQENLTSGTACTKTSGIYTNRFAAFTGDTILPGVAWESCAAKAGQVYVTMQVNMEFETVDSTGVFLGGGSGFGTPGQNLMHHIGDSVYSITLPRDTGFFSFFTFMNGNCPSWGCKENLAGKPCGDPANYNDRSVGSALYGDFHLTTCFGQCSTDGSCATPPSPVNVTFRSDRTNSPSFTDAYLSGTMNGWSGDATAMTDADGDGVYEVTVSLLPGAYEWKFTADNWAVQENLDPATSDSVCTITQGAFTNRYMMLGGTADTTLEIHGWEQCGNASTVGIDEATAEFVVKPNPASDVLFIENTTGTASTVAIYNVTGAKVMEQNFEANTRLDVATLPRGMYIVRLQSEDTDSVIRISLN